MVDPFDESIRELPERVRERLLALDPRERVLVAAVDPDRRWPERACVWSWPLPPVLAAEPPVVPDPLVEPEPPVAPEPLVEPAPLVEPVDPVCDVPPLVCAMAPAASPQAANAVVILIQGMTCFSSDIGFNCHGER